MTRVCVEGVSISLDGYMAGPRQDRDNPIGVGGRRLHEWIFATKSGRSMIGESGGSQGVDDDVFNYDVGVTATIMGRNMFGPIRGPWADSEWTGWWGESPPFHRPVYVLTHYARPSFTLDDTTFHFVTGGVHEALDLAREAAGAGNVGVSGGAQNLKAFFEAELLDEINVSVVPVTMLDGERLFDVVGEWPVGYEVSLRREGEGATHYRLVRS